MKVSSQLHQAYYMSAIYMFVWKWNLELWMFWIFPFLGSFLSLFATHPAYVMSCIFHTFLKSESDSLLSDSSFLVSPLTAGSSPQLLHNFVKVKVVWYQKSESLLLLGLSSMLAAQPGLCIILWEWKFVRVCDIRKVKVSVSCPLDISPHSCQLTPPYVMHLSYVF